MKQLVTEFNTFRGLFPIKILVTGAPASSKSYFCQMIANKYGIPLIQIGQLIEKGYASDTKLGEKMRKKFEKIKDQVVAEYNKKKKKKDPELDRNTIRVRLQDKYLY